MTAPFHHRKTLAFALAISVSALPFAEPNAQEAGEERPLGILFPGYPQPTNTPVSTPLPQNISSGNAASNGKPTSSPNPTTGSKPLGTLINTNVPATGSTGSVLPKDWNRATSGTAPRAGSVTPVIPQSTDRPLGTLINVAPTTVSGGGTTASAQRPTAVAPDVRRASRVQTAPAANASTARPLGTLFGAQPVQPPLTRSASSSGSAGTGVTAPTIQPTGNNPPPKEAELSADSMTYDRELGLITATGNVQIGYGDAALFAEKVTYNQKTDVVLATGNVSLTDASGRVILGDRMEVTGDLKDGVIYNIGLVLEDKSRIAGNGARRTNGTTTELSQGVYSPCNLCEDDPTAAPLWQLKAVRVTHDAEDKQVSYRNVWLELYGIPVAYTPFLSHPDPTVKRRSGILAPSFGNSSDLGFQLRAPYFWAIDEHQDATFTPMLSTDGGQGAIVEYRRAFKKGKLEATGSFVADDPDKDLRGYIDIDGEYHLNPTWRTGLKIEQASDDTYTRRYGFQTENVLTSRAYLEGFRGQNYQALNAYAFDDLRAGIDPDQSPIILPMYDFNYAGRRDRLGGYSSFDFNILNLSRNTGTDTRRIAFRPRWDRPFIGSFGEIYNASVSLSADGYHSSGLVRDDGTEFTGLSGRIVPRAALSWRLPLIRQGPQVSQTIEPLASVVIAPNGGNPDNIPNEDSQELEFDETNLFNENRFDGFDKIDGGSRFNYGFNYILTDLDAGSTSVFLGQSYRPRLDDSFGQASGLEDHFSDIVGRVQITPRRYLDLIYRTQFSPDNFSPQRNQVTANIGAPALQLSANYLFIDTQEGSEFSGREEISGSLSSQYNENWSAAISARHDISEDDLRSFGLDVKYENECVIFTTRFSRTFFQDRDIEPTDSVTFTLVLKTLGEVRSGVTKSQ